MAYINALSLEGLRGFDATRRVACAEQDPVAGFPELAGDFQANALVGARDQGDTAICCVHGMSFD
jgi:hypothetical protein